ncbi:MAG: 4'-phosphopantetheinyl transferase superfamily protein [Syntrophales bacterium]|nr:4'-phosphopantetheinyl transferase superfamily protein [Syntrophales bacterium]
MLDLPDGGVHLWFALPDEWKDSTLIESARHLLGDEEMTRMERFHFPEHRHLYLVSHLLLRTTLSRYSHFLPNAWRFVTNDHGKPRLDPDAGPIPLCFSLSHTRGLSVVGVTREGEIGVDVEQVRRSVNAAELSRRFFSPEETAALEKLPPGRLQAQFPLYWTLKEAYIKALGRGLSHPLDSFSFRLTGERPHRIGFSAEEPQEPEGWRFALIAPRPQSVAALCVASARNIATELSCTLALPSGETAPLRDTLLGLSAGVVYKQ